MGRGRGFRGEWKATRTTAVHVAGTGVRLEEQSKRGQSQTAEAMTMTMKKEQESEPWGGNLGNIHSGGKQTRSNKNYNN